MARLRNAVLLALVALLCLSQVQADPTKLTIAAGVDGVFNVRGLGADSNGDLLIADYDSNRVKRLFFNGTLVTIAGTGEADTSGDGGYAFYAQTNRPYDVVGDKVGNVFFTEVDGHVIRRIDLDGTISTITGNLSPGTFLDGALAETSLITNPNYITIAPNGNIFFGQFDGDVNYITPDGKIYHFLTGVSGIIRGIAVDNNGHLLLSHGSILSVYKISDASLLNTDFSAFIGRPAEIAIGDNGLIYVADYGNDKVHSFKITSTVAIESFGDGLESEAPGSFDNPRGLAYANGNLAVGSDGDVTGIRAIVPFLNLPFYPKVIQAGSNDVNTEVLSICSPLNDPIDITYSSFMNMILIADSEQHVILGFDPSFPSNIQVVAGTVDVAGYDGTHLNGPNAVFSDDFAFRILIADTGNHAIISFDGSVGTKLVGGGPTGTPVRSADGPAASVTITSPYSVVADQAGNVYFSEGSLQGTIDAVIRVLDGSGNVRTLLSADGTVGDISGLLFEESTQRLFFAYGPTIATITVSDTTPTLNIIAGNTIFTGFDDGDATSVATFSDFIYGLAAQRDASSGDIIKLFIADTDNGALRALEIASSTVSTVVGNGTPLYGAYDTVNRYASRVVLSQPGGVVFTDTGLFLSDFDQGLVFKLCSDDTPGCDLCANYPHGDCLSTCDSACQDPANGRDLDDDMACDLLDNCLDVTNIDQKDYDLDLVGDACDNCKYKPNFGQEDTDKDGNGADAPDGVGDACDNCPLIPNPSQTDTDLDSQGNDCDTTPRGSPRPSGSSGNRPTAGGSFSIWNGPTFQAAPAV